MSSTLGSRIRAARLKKGLTQSELAKKAGASSHTIICDYEKGKRGTKHPDIRFLLKIASVLDISIDYLFLGKENK
jgi:repressor LexA